MVSLKKEGFLRYPKGCLKIAFERDAKRGASLKNGRFMRAASGRAPARKTREGEPRGFRFRT